MRVTFVPYEPTSTQQRKEILALLVEAFGDYLPYYEEQLSLVATADTTYLYADEQGSIVAHIQVVPYTAEGKAYPSRLRVAYLYAICTAADLRGQGVMGQMLPDLLSLLPTRGYSHAALVPAELSLVDHYKRFGFVPMAGGVALESDRPEADCLLRPGEAARQFVAKDLALDELYGTAPSLPLSVPAGWMLSPLGATSPHLPLDTILLSPML